MFCFSFSCADLLQIHLSCLICHHSVLVVFLGVVVLLLRRSGWCSHVPLFHYYYVVFQLIWQCFLFSASVCRYSMFCSFGVPGFIYSMPCNCIQETIQFFLVFSSIISQKQKPAFYLEVTQLAIIIASIIIICKKLSGHP